MFPVKFEDVSSEVTFLALYHLLDIGSGYDPLLLSSCRRDAREMLQFAVIGMRLSGVPLEAPWMKAFSAMSVHNFFGFDATEEVPVMPGVLMTRPGPLHPLSQALQHTIADTGRHLDAAGQRSLGNFILDRLDSRAAAGRPCTASDLVEALAAAFPAFRDEASAPAAGAAAAQPAAAASAVSDSEAAAVPAAESSGEPGPGAGFSVSGVVLAASEGPGGAGAAVPVRFVRRAQNLVADLQLRFSKDDARFAFPDVERTTADSGSTLPAVLRHYGVLEYSPELAGAIDKEEVLVAGSPQEVALRAAAVTAADDIAAAADGVFSSRQLSAYFTYLMEPDRELCKLKRHLTPGSGAY